jgi:hypothetical protein
MQNIFQNFIDKERTILFLGNNSKAKKAVVIFLVCLFITTLFSSIAFANSRVDIFGFIRDDDTGNPIYNARVDLFYDQDSIPFISVFSDNNGRIDQPVYASRTVKRIEITRSGYKKAVYTIPSYSHTIDLGTKYLVEGVTREDTYKVYGTVLDDRDDSYISDARVVLIDNYDDITYVGYTNSRGYFDVVNLPLSDYEVCVTKYGYRDYEMRNLLRLRTGDYDLGTIRLERTGTSAPSVKTLAGRITDEDGYYVQGAEVYLLDSNGEEIKTKTDARGYYTFRDIAAKTYTIGVNAAGYELLERIDFVKIISTDIEKEVNLMVKTESRKGYDVYGRVVDENRKYIEGVEVSLIDGNTRIKKVLTDAIGYYEFRYVPDGRYTIEFKKLGYQTKTLSNEIRVDGSYYPVSQTELREKKGSTTVVGGLVGDSQSGLSNIIAYLEDSTDSYSARTNYFGFFTFNDVKEGTYNLYATINNTKKLLETNIRVAGSQIDIGDININRVDSGYKITGNVKDTDNYKIGNAKITVTAGGIKKETVTDSGGNYSLAGLERGEYTIAVTKEGYGTASEKINITSYDLDKNFTLRPNDYIKVNYADISLAVNEQIDLDKFISKVEIYSSRGALLDTITSRYEISVPAEYADYLAAYANNEIRGKKTGEAYIEISIRNSRDYDHLSPALLKVTITEPVLAREAILTIGTNSYTLDGKAKTSDAVPYIKNGRSFFPLRVMAEVLGVTDENIKWDSATRTATLIKDSDTVEITVGQKYYKHNGITKPMDVQAENIYGRIYLPARYVSEALGGEIEWNGITKTLIIRSN